MFTRTIECILTYRMESYRIGKFADCRMLSLGFELDLGLWNGTWN